MEFKVYHDISTVKVHLGVQKKFIQFVIVLHIFLHGWPMLEYESWKDFFLVLKGQYHPIETLVRQQWLTYYKSHAWCGLFEGGVCHFRN
jgi:hypothetical protein